MAVLVLPPFRIYPDKSGEPLSDGLIYVGEPNQDPSTNPVAIYWDAALTIPAANPVRTLNGYANNNGSPGNIYAADDYSIRITDRRNVVLYSAATTSETGIGTIVLRAGDALIVEAGARVFVADGARLEVGDDTGVAARIVMAPNARIFGDLIPGTGGTLGTDAAPWLDVSADEAHIDALVTNEDGIPANGPQIDASVSGGRVKLERLEPVSTTTSRVGSYPAPFASAAIKVTSSNDFIVLGTAQPLSDTDLLKLSARSMTLASGQVTVSGGVGTLSTQSQNFDATVSYVLGGLQLQFLQAVHPESRVYVGCYRAGTPLIHKERITGGGTIVEITFTDNAGAAADASIVNIEVIGPGSASGIANITPIPT